MISVNVKRKTNNLEKLLLKIKKLGQSKVESGYFAEQGNHPTAGMPYAELAFIHEKGEGNFPSRSVREPTRESMHFGEFRNATFRLLDKHLYHNKVTIDGVLDSIGWRVTDIAQSYFGQISPYMPANSPEWADFKGGNTPLVMDGHLRDAWSYKTSENTTIRGL